MINLEIKDCLLVCVGDQGLGFVDKKQTLDLFNRLNDWFKERNY